MAGRNSSQKQTLEKLHQAFGKTLDFEIIQSVAFNCNFDFARTQQILAELTGNVHASPPKQKKIKKPENVNHKTPKKQPNCNAHKRVKSDVDRVVDLIQDGTKVLVIMRGLPGSGKSFLAKKILETTVGIQYYRDCIYSADDFFMQNNVYVYNPSKISDAHSFCQNRAFNAMRSGVAPVIIDNTNTQIWEMKPYAQVAMQYGYIIEILEPTTSWAFSDKELARRNTHGVPRVKLKEMLERYERNIAPQKLMSAFSLSYRTVVPQTRRFPPMRIQKKQPFPLENKTNGKILPKSASNFPTIDLLNLGDEASSIYVSDSEECTETKPNHFSIDDIFTCRDNTGEILKPAILQFNTLETKKTTDDASEASSSGSSQKNSNNTSPKQLYPDLDLSAWGLDEKALQSWEMYTPITQQSSEVSMDDSSSEVETKPEMKDSECNTTAEDFDRALRPVATYSSDVKWLNAFGREINSRGTPSLPMKPRKKMLTDQSCSTDEDLIIVSPDRENDMDQLEMLFPNIPRDYLREMYEKCKCDVNWTVNLLCEDGKHDDYVDFLKEKDFTVQQTDIVEVKEGAVSMETEENAQKTSSPNFGQIFAESLLKFKEKIEKSFETKQEYYSLGVEYARQGLNGNRDVQQPSTSKVETCVTDAGNVIAIDSDIDMDDFDFDNRSDGNSSNDEQQMVEINLGETLVSELETKLKEPGFECPKGFQPLVQIPVNLARQLYAFYVESVYQQLDAQKEVLDTLVKEDEEFAKKLQEQENNVHNPSQQTDNLKDIMDEQYALSLYQKETEQWKDLTPDDLAAKLTKQKLYENFPAIDRGVLVEVWQAHGNNYQETVQSIIASNPSYGNKENIMEKPISDVALQEMQEAYRQTQVPEGENTGRTAISYREEASKCLEKRQALYQRAQTALQKGMTEVAMFYSDLAKKQTQMYDRANGLAASIFLNEHSQRLQNYDTLDLHFLYVKEAIPALDMFIDNNIHLLKGSKKSQTLFIITGRGKRSLNGISRIKPAVKNRLKKRNITFAEMNPGLLKIKITEYSMITSDIV